MKENRPCEGPGVQKPAQQYQTNQQCALPTPKSTVFEKSRFRKLRPELVSRISFCARHAPKPTLPRLRCLEVGDD